MEHPPVLQPAKGWNCTLRTVFDGLAVASGRLIWGRADPDHPRQVTVPSTMIISASYRTDIPAFHAPWFLRRLAAGRVRVANPYGGAPSDIPLGTGHVSGFVLWTRNLKPLMADLRTVAARAPFTIQFTVTGYPRALESALIEASTALAQIQAVRRDWGPRAAVW